MSAAWREKAACARIAPDLWFPEAGGSSNAPKQICASCPVRLQCLGFALTNDIQYGIFGGLSPLARRNLKHSAA